MRVSIVAFLWCLCSVALAQTTTVTPIDIEIQKADVVFLNKKYNSAATLYKKIYNKVKDEDQQANINFKIAESYRLSNNFKLAFDYFLVITAQQNIVYYIISTKMNIRFNVSKTTFNGANKIRVSTLIIQSSRLLYLILFGRLKGFNFVCLFLFSS